MTVSENQYLENDEVSIVSTMNRMMEWVLMVSTGFTRALALSLGL